MVSLVDKSKGFLARLARSQRGNTLAIVAAALIPLAGMIGGGLDISRGYLAQTRLQQACDAGVLAGRKVMGSSGVVSNDVIAEVRKYVAFNYPDNYLGSVAPTVNPTLGTNDQIQLTVSTTVPTAVMRLFKKDTMAITASCSARNDYANIDIVLVLDTTGSMACKPERTKSQCSTFANGKSTSGYFTNVGRTIPYIVEETDGTGNISRMQGLRNALASLQSQMATIETQFNMTEEGKRKRVRWAIVPFSQMVNAGFSRDSTNTTLYDRKPTWFNTTADYYDVDYYNGKRLNNISHSASWLSNTWDGCVEERKTSNSITKTSGNSIPDNLPSSAYDLMFDTAPTSADTRWTVSDPGVTSGQYACPKFMREMSQMSTSDFTSYFAFSNGFVSNGGTWLDNGLLWAARLLSRTGLWASENPTLYHTFPVQRYVIMMTDGEMETGTNNYAAYAQEGYWKRVASNGTSTQSDSNHTARMLMTCNAIKNMDVKIYTISFGSASDLSDDLIDCSSGAENEYAFKADNSDQLDAVFRDIGENIGSLRLSQ